MGNGKSDYVQLTVRLPRFVLEKLELVRRRFNLSLQDAFLIVLLEYITLNDCETWLSIAEGRA